MPKKGNQSPTRTVVLNKPKGKSRGQEAIDLYNSSGNKAQPWQEKQLNNLLAVTKDGKWVHSRYGFSVPRRNGKSEILIMRELYALFNGEHVMHTAHLATTSSDTADRLARCLDNMGYKEVIRVSKEEVYDKHYVYHKQFGNESITLLRDGGGMVEFRTRTARGVLGQGVDVLIVDEAQEYQEDQESSLKYTVSSSKNPQTIMTGTPPTAVSQGTVFPNYRNKVLDGNGSVPRSGWAEWSVSAETDPYNRDAWYQTNPSLGTIFNEENVEDEIGDNVVDFNIQRLGLWYKESLNSAISAKDWKALKVDKPSFAVPHRLFAAVKFGKDGQNAVLAVATKTTDGKIFVEVIDSKPMSEGFKWILNWLAMSTSVVKTAVDGLNGQAILANAMHQEKLKPPVLPSGIQFYTANSLFEQGIYAKTICHTCQQPLLDAVSHCEKVFSKRGGFNYQSLGEYDVTLMDAVILAHWLCSEDKGETKQRMRD